MWTATSGVSIEDLFALLRVARGAGSGLSGWRVDMDACSSGAVWTTGTDVFTEDLSVLPFMDRDVVLGTTGWWCVEVDSCSLGAAGSSTSGVLMEDLSVLARQG